MGKTEKVFVMGHKNPDTDSICSAIAYSDIKNRVSQNYRYIPRRAGQINEETRFVLERFNIPVPGYMPNVGTQVKDMDIRVTPPADENITVKKAWDLLRGNNINTLPITDSEGCLEGLVTVRDIAQTYMDNMNSYLLSKARTQYIRIAETLDGQVIEGNAEGFFTEGKVMICTMNLDVLNSSIEEKDMVILGDREEDHILAIEKNVSCMIIGLNMDFSEKVKKMAHEKGIVIIKSPYDTFTISRLINQSIPVGYIMIRDNLIAFNTEEFTDNIKDIMIKKRHQSFPVINKKNKCIGTISRRNFMNMHKKKVVLVDHNENDQAADNITSANVIEIIDHHKVGSLETSNPIHFRNEPVGCTATILYEMYNEQRLEIAPDIAGLLCSAIISDTLMFRSPTCTLMDKMAAGALALIADIKIEEYAKEMFKAGSNLKYKLPEEIFYQDYKKFVGEGDITFGVGQITSMDEEELLDIKEKLVPFIQSEHKRSGISKTYFMLTDILKESSIILYYGEGSEEMGKIAFQTDPENGVFFLQGVVSRKKQLIPRLMDAVAAMDNQLE